MTDDNKFRSILFQTGYYTIMSRLHRSKGHDTGSNDIFGATRRAQIKQEHDASLMFRNGTATPQAVAPLAFCERSAEGTYSLTKKAGLQYTLGNIVYETSTDGIINIVNSDYLKERVYAAHDELETIRAPDLPAGGIFGRRHPLLCSIFRQSRVKGSK